MNLRKLSIGVLAALMTFASGCQKNYLDINNNPNQVTAATPVLVLPSALSSSGSYFSTSFTFLNLWMGYWNWSGNYSIATSDKNYQFTSNFGTGIWDNGYIILKNYDYTETQAASLKQPLVQGIAKIMKALHFQILVDTYGNIPYTQSLQGLASSQPAYDNATAVYEDLFKQIDAALTLFSDADKLAAQGGTVLNPGTNDIMFKGDIAKWRRFANTLKLRMLLRQSEKADRQAFIQTQLATIKASGYGFLKSGENAAVNPGYANSAGQQSPFYGTYGYQVNGQPIEAYNINRSNKYAIDFYQSTNDPRLARFYAPVGGSGTTFNGTFFGTIAPVANNQTSGIGPGLLSDVNQPAYIMTSHEAFFLQAEAAQRGWIEGDPKTLYQQAITESFVNVGLTAADAAAYYAQATANVGWDASTNKIQLIVTQKWASLNGWSPFEAWSDYRRLGVPNVPISQDPSTSVKQIPVRLFYPQSEYNYNSSVVRQQGDINQFTSKIFWVR
ncbi:SusD/RagB family nutrient-binding outer membrane lipoprotein [Spirosoma sp.]|uniref:SusD/RagB family nutrient-binding outer membrane lipoprotein n=1 Tax=Spirosoma sp. TaxID=1899569 RepID=UPI0026102244|nr:SusD/RagB family nutrient-binding outer membrane lipoprotein [Spirosoma sp.]MCX6214951.1 SusD/RagB family nutrient-binding outer membrane lipoprotein [Spirosoma sp.]